MTVGKLLVGFAALASMLTQVHATAGSYSRGSLRTGVDSDSTPVAREKPAKAGSEFKECPSGCPVMVIIPAGTFVMGSSDANLSSIPDHEANLHGRESPQHEVTFAEPFAASKFEVTFAEWDACVGAGACPEAPDNWGRGNMPVINVSWDDAKKYVNWLSLLTGADYRLLSEAEWEYAARAGAKTRYSWGESVGTNNANCDGCGSAWDLQQTSPVGFFKPNAFGLYDVHGNVWEWVEDTWHENYEGAPTNGSAWLSGAEPEIRIIRGGAWRNESYLIRAALRERRHVRVRFDTLGLRVARTLDP